MAGLIESQVPDQDKFLKATATGYDPSLGVVDLNTDTVSSQLDAFLSKDNPLTARSDARVAQAFNARGLINSSMAAGAAEAARIDTALPVAMADAQNFSTQRLTNQAATNTAKQFTAGATNTADLTNAAAGNQFGLIGSQGAETRKTQAEGATQAQQLATLQGGIQTGMIGAQGEQARLTQAQGITGQKELQAMVSNTQITLADKQIAMQQYLSDTDNAMRKALADIQANTTMSVADKQIASQQAIAAAENAMKQTLADIQSNTTLSVADKQALTQTTIHERAIQAQKDLQTADLQAKAIMQQADSATKLALSNIEADYKTLMQTSASAGDLYKGAMASMTAIMADPNLDAESKQTALDNQITILKSGMNLIGSVNGIDLSDLLPA